MELSDKYFIAVSPVVTDDDGYLGYLWEGRVFSNTKDFKYEATEALFYTPESAMKAAEEMYNNKQING